MIPPDRIERIQEAIREEGLAGWIFFDFHGTNPIARSILGVGAGPGAAAAAPKTTRRWFYLVPAHGPPRKLTHRLEPNVLDHLPGDTTVYLTWQELDRALADLVGPLATAHVAAGGPGAAVDAEPAVAMEYSPLARLPYVSRVDSGTVEMVRAAGARVVSSADLAQRFDGVLSPDARLDHRHTGRIVSAIIDGAFGRVRDSARGASGGGALTEGALQRWMLERYAEEGLVSSDPPTVAVDAHSGDPHFSNSTASDASIREGSFLLIDAWAKAARPGAVYADYTKVAFVGAECPERMAAIFDVVRDARDAAIATVAGAVAAGRPVRGCDVDDAARAVIRLRGYGERFVHRTGHSIGEEVHGNGVHLDNLETRDERLLLTGTLVSVEPGIYLEEFGVRSEVDLLLDDDGVSVTGDPQRKLEALLA